MTPRGCTATGWRCARSSTCSRGSHRCPSPSACGCPGLHPGRAPTIVAGAVILVQVMRAFSLDEIEVSERDILHGSALSAAFAPAQ